MGRRGISVTGGPARDAEQLTMEIAVLRSFSLAELRQRWRALGGATLPKGLPAFLVLRLLAFRLQAQRFGDLGPDLRKALVRRGRGEKLALPIPGADRGAARTLAVGTLLTREWAGHVHHVMVLADGFAWNGRTFGSLSEVARAITGTRWSGPTFFGLKTKATLRAPASNKSKIQTGRPLRVATARPADQSAPALRERGAS